MSPALLSRVDSSPIRHSAIYSGWVRHRRHLPHPHAFRYRLFQVYLDLEELPTLFAGHWFWSHESRNLASYRRTDYLGPTDMPLVEAVRLKLRQTTGERIDGPIRLLTHLRYFGYINNPVSFYYCFDQDGQTLRHIVAEITNTPWGERHQYVLPMAQATRHGNAWHFAFDKGFHVSPFLPMNLRYDWRFNVPGPELRIHMNASSGEEKRFDATLVLGRRPWTGTELAKALIRFPWMTFTVLRAIYWQAFLIRCKRNPFYAHP